MPFKFPGLHDAPFAMPPAKYDAPQNPNAPKPLVTQVDLNQLVKACEQASGQKISNPGGELGCEVTFPDGSSMVFVPNQKTWPGTKETWDQNLKHEMGHANGWPANHPKE